MILPPPPDDRGAAFAYVKTELLGELWWARWDYAEGRYDRLLKGNPPPFADTVPSDITTEFIEL